MEKREKERKEIEPWLTGLPMFYYPIDRY
jgi:hypothetical protein